MSIIYFKIDKFEGENYFLGEYQIKRDTWTAVDTLALNKYLKWNLLTGLDAELIITNSSLEEVNEVLWNGGVGTPP